MLKQLVAHGRNVMLQFALSLSLSRLVEAQRPTVRSAT